MAGLKREICVLLFLFSITTTVVMGFDEEGESADKGIFMLRKSKRVIKTEGGEVSVLRGYSGKGISSPMQIGFITMEPKTLFIPQYIDSSFILFVRRGEMKIGWVHKSKTVEKNLKTGDLYRISAGSTFYMVNTYEGEKLHLICSIDTSESLGLSTFQSFFIGGGTYPQSVLAGFDTTTLQNAFNVSADELHNLMKRQRGGPIVYASDSDQPGRWASLMQLKHQRREEEDNDEREFKQDRPWSWRKLLNSVLGKDVRREKESTVSSSDSYNLYDREPDFKNDYGWSVALDEHDYSPLKSSGIGIYLVNLTAGSMMAPHVNPTATEYGIILSGTGSIQVVFPNGSSAMNTNVKEGDVFWVPRYFPFCQIASQSGTMEFFGFTTSARKNRPQFLAGASSLLRSMSGPELATSFNVSENRLKRIVESQSESVILPSLQTPSEKMGRGVAKAAI